MDGAALRYLDDAGFIPGATGTVTTKAPDGTLIVSVGEQSVALGAGSLQAALRRPPLILAGAVTAPSGLAPWVLLVGPVLVDARLARS